MTAPLKHRPVTRSPAEKRRDRTTWVRDIKTGDAICVFDGRHHAFDAVSACIGGTVFAWTSVQHGDCEGVEYITVDGEPVAWIDEGGTFTTDAIEAALFPMAVAAE